jgi:hypothetical protein
MMTNELAVKNTSSLMPALTMDEAAHRYNMVVEYTKKLMTDGKDYGVIPGTGKKPTLLKPGAEKLCSLFGLVPVFEVLDKITDFDKGMFYFQYLCKLEKNGSIVGTGIGSCNSKEKKYRYRYVMEWEASDSDKENAVEIISVKGRNGRNYNKYKMENSEPFELVNTIDKMAQKRALVAATLIATNASEFFTQDIEDMDFVEGTFSDVDETEQPEPKTKRKPAPKQSADDVIDDAGPVLPTSGYDFKTRPYDAPTLKAALAKKVEKIGSYEASDKQRNLLGALLSEYFQDDTKRYECSEWLFGARSTKDIDGAMVKAALDWLNPQKDEGGAYAIDPMAKKELGYAHTAALEASGQEALL